MIPVLVEIILSNVIVFFAFLVLGLIGFGYGIIAVALLLLFLDIKLVVPTIAILDFLTVSFLSLRYRKHIRRDLLLPILLGGLIGVVLGSCILISVDSLLLKKLFGVLVVLFSLRISFRKGEHVKLNKVFGFPVGLISGLVSSMFGSGGPPVVIYFYHQIKEKEFYRATLLSYFVFLGLWKLNVFLFSGLLNWQILNFSLYLFPSLIIGTVTGLKLHTKINESLFRKIVTFFLLFTGVTLII